MRHVSRPPEPASLSSAKTLAERQAAEDFYAAWDGSAKYTKYAAYKADDVKATLQQAFRGKCAYCESSYSATQPMAVEHYRPKGEVVIAGKRTPPGYYWLASAWDNLLPSCTDCNSPRRQVLPDGTAVVGKANAFPLSAERTRAFAPGAESAERRLVLHPYLDRPERHLTFDGGFGTAGEGWVTPTRNARGRVSAKGKATIEVCGLLRQGLVRARHERLLLLVAALESVREAYENIASDPARPALREQYERRLAAVAPFVADDAPYVTMARQVVDEYWRRLFGGDP